MVECERCTISNSVSRQHEPRIHEHPLPSQGSVQRNDIFHRHRRYTLQALVLPSHGPFQRNDRLCRHRRYTLQALVLQAKAQEGLCAAFGKNKNAAMGIEPRWKRKIITTRPQALLSTFKLQSTDSSNVDAPELMFKQFLTIMMLRNSFLNHFAAQELIFK